MQVNLRQRAKILGMIVLLLILLILALLFFLPQEPPYQISPFELTATWIKEQNATIEGFIQQTQAAMTQTPIP